MHTIGLGALQQRNMPEIRRCGFEHAHQIAQHPVVGFDLPGVTPAIDQARRLIERGIDQMGCTAELSRGAAAILSAGEIDRHVPRTAEIAWFAARQRDALAIVGCAEVSQGGAADQAGRAGDHDFLVGHVLELPSTRCLRSRSRQAPQPVARVSDETHSDDFPSQLQPRPALDFRRQTIILSDGTGRNGFPHKSPSRATGHIITATSIDRRRKTAPRSFPCRGIGTQEGYA